MNLILALISIISTLVAALIIVWQHGKNKVNQLKKQQADLNAKRYQDAIDRRIRLDQDMRDLTQKQRKESEREINQLSVSDHFNQYWHGMQPKSNGLDTTATAADKTVTPDDTSE